MSGGSTTISPTADQIAQQQTNANLWNYYMQYYHPIIQKYAASTSAPGNEKASEGQVQGQLNADMMKYLAEHPSQAGKGANAVANAKLLGAAGESGALSKEQGIYQAKKRQAGEIGNVEDIGRGEQLQAQAAQSTIAQESIQQGEFTKNLQMQEAGAEENMFGSAIGGIGAGFMASKGKGLSVGQSNAPISLSSMYDYANMNFATDPNATP